LPVTVRDIFESALKANQLDSDLVLTGLREILDTQLTGHITVGRTGNLIGASSGAGTIRSTEAYHIGVLGEVIE
jgi:hypothetical protein